MLKFALGCMLAFTTILHGVSESTVKPLRLSSALALPSWFEMTLNHRLRYESLSNQFRPHVAGADQLLTPRTLLMSGVHFGRISAAIELMDARVYLADANTPVDTTIADPLDVLQAYFQLREPAIFAAGDSLTVKTGRMTIDAGNRRFVARARFRNTINNFTGVDAVYSSASTDRIRLFVTAPVHRLPDNRESLIANTPVMDRETFETQFAGLYFESQKRLEPLQAEIYVLGLNENDPAEFVTKKRKFLTPGIRVFTPPTGDAADFEVETALQAGSNRASASTMARQELRHFAYFFHLSFGYTFKSLWSLRPSLEYDYASGDRNPNDDEDGRFDPLYGARRSFLGPTSLYGPFALSNINSPGVRVEVRPNSALRLFLFWRSVWLAQASDAWTTTGLRDATGASGTYLGQQLEGEIAYKLLPGNITLEAGFACLWTGGFQEQRQTAMDNSAYFFTGIVLEL